MVVSSTQSGGRGGDQDVSVGRGSPPASGGEGAKEGNCPAVAVGRQDGAPRRRPAGRAASPPRARGLDGTVHLSALTHLTVLPVPDRLRRPPSPTHSVAAARSRGFRHASGTTRPSDSSTGIPSHFALAYRAVAAVPPADPPRSPRVTLWSAPRFRTVPSAHTLVRWVDESAFRLHSAGSTLPHLWPTGPPRFVTGSPP